MIKPYYTDRPYRPLLLTRVNCLDDPRYAQWLHNLYRIDYPAFTAQISPEDLLHDIMGLADDTVGFILFLFAEDDPSTPVMFQASLLIPKYQPATDQLTLVFRQPGQVLDMSRISEKDAKILKEYGWGYLAAVMEMAYNRMAPVGAMPDTLVSYIPTAMERMLSEVTHNVYAPVALQLNYFDPTQVSPSVDKEHMHVFFNLILQTGRRPGWCLYGVCLYSDMLTAIQRVRTHQFGKHYLTEYYDRQRPERGTMQHFFTTILRTKPAEPKIYLQ